MWMLCSAFGLEGPCTVMLSVIACEQGNVWEDKHKWWSHENKLTSGVSWQYAWKVSFPTSAYPHSCDFANCMCIPNVSLLIGYLWYKPELKMAAGSDHTCQWGFIKEIENLMLWLTNWNQRHCSVAVNIMDNKAVKKHFESSVGTFLKWVERIEKALEIWRMQKLKSGECVFTVNNMINTFVQAWNMWVYLDKPLCYCLDFIILGHNGFSMFVSEEAWWFVKTKLYISRLKLNKHLKNMLIKMTILTLTLSGFIKVSQGRKCWEVKFQVRKILFT